MILSRPDDNCKYFKRKDATPDAVLSGSVPCPPEFLRLSKELDMIIERKGRYAGLECVKTQKQLAGSGRDLLKAAMLTSDLPSGWEQATAGDGKVYYYNAITKKSQWE